MNDISVQLPLTPSKSPTKAKSMPQADSDSDIEIVDTPSSPMKPSPSKSLNKFGRNNAGALLNPSRNGPSAKAKGKRRARTEAIDEDDNDEAEGQVATASMPSDAVFATWRKGDDDLEPSTKMLGLVDLLNEWDSTGDKTICYSQCRPPTAPLS
jgi:hypothetical protein